MNEMNEINQVNPVNEEGLSVSETCSHESCSLGKDQLAEKSLNVEFEKSGLYEKVAGSIVPECSSEELTYAGEESRLYGQKYKAVTDEIASVLQQVKPSEVTKMMTEIIRSDKIFVIGVGRVFLSLQCLAKRLAHFGFDINIVGSVVEKSITDKDLLLVASGSGESKLPVSIARIAKQYNARVGLITSSRSSTIKSMADVVVHLPSPTKTDMGYGVKSIQSMSTLFDQCLHIFGDVLCLMLQERTGQTNEDLKRRHANLE